MKGKMGMVDIYFFFNISLFKYIRMDACHGDTLTEVCSFFFLWGEG